MSKTKKTNAMRTLDRWKVDYELLSYDTSDGKIDGISVAQKVAKEVTVVYKTLVTQGNSKEFYVFVIPVDKELDLKKAAAACGEKKVEMIALKDILKYTGYMRGGCSPLGMKKVYKTFVDQSAMNIEKIIISAGKIGMQIELRVEDLLEITPAVSEKLIK